MNTSHLPEAAENRLRNLLRHHVPTDAAAALEPVAASNTALMLQAMKKRSRRFAAIPTALQVALGGAMSIATVAFLKADNIHAEVMLATVFLLLVALAMTLCLWTWLRRHHLVTLREIKRLELAIALLTEHSEASESKDEIL